MTVRVMLTLWELIRHIQIKKKMHINVDPKKIDPSFFRTKIK